MDSKDKCSEGKKAFSYMIMVRGNAIRIKKCQSCFDKNNKCGNCNEMGHQPRNCKKIS